MLDDLVQDFVQGGGHWNADKINNEVHPEDVAKILSIKLSSKAEVDLLGWNYNDSGLYTVKSGYWLTTHLPEYEGGHAIYGVENIKQRVWKIDTPTKLKHFLWKMTSRSLATGSNLQRRHIVRDGQCRRCCLELETEKHIFFDYPYAQKIWRRAGISSNIINSSSATFEENIDACLQYSSSTRLTHFLNIPIWILWRIWKSRNLLIFQHKGIYWERILQQAQRDASEWKAYSNDIIRADPGNERTTNTKIWQNPSQG